MRIITSIIICIAAYTYGTKSIFKELLSTSRNDSLNFTLNTFTSIPSEIDGCACYFYLSREDEKNETYFFVNDFASTAFVSINNKIERFELKEHRKGDDIYVYSNGDYELKVEIKRKQNFDKGTSVMEGLIRLSKGGKAIQRNFVGSCGC